MRRKLPPKRRSHVEVVSHDAPSPNIPNRIEIPDFIRDHVTPQQLALIEAMLEFDLERAAKPSYRVSQPLSAHHEQIEQATGKRLAGGGIAYPAHVTREQAREQYPILCDQLREELKMQAKRITETIRAHGFDPATLTTERSPCYFNHNTIERQDFPVIDLAGWLGDALSHCLPEPVQAPSR